MLEDAAAREGDWLVALSQSQGRGRQGRQWSMIEGNFAGSTIVLLRDGDPAPQTLSLVAGLAAIEAADIAVPGRELVLKWPNDLLLEGAKLAGVLLERSGYRVAVGIGVNLAAAPAIESRATASLDGAISATAFAPLLAASFARWLERWRNGSAPEIADAWLRRAHPLGSALTVHLDAATTTAGRFEGLGPDGALLLRTGETIVAIRAGDVLID